MTYSDRRSRVFGCAILIALPLILLGLAVSWFSGGPYTSNVPTAFNADGWKAAKDDTRCRMIADLRFRVGVVGKTRAQLYDLLGETEDEDSDPNLSHWHLCPSFMDIYILEVRWCNNRVANAWVRDT